MSFEKKRKSSSKNRQEEGSQSNEADEGPNKELEDGVDGVMAKLEQLRVRT